MCATDAGRIDLVLLAYKMFFCLTINLFIMEIYSITPFRFVSFRFVSFLVSLFLGLQTPGHSYGQTSTFIYN